MKTISVSVPLKTCYRIFRTNRSEVMSSGFAESEVKFLFDEDTLYLLGYHHAPKRLYLDTRILGPDGLLSMDAFRRRVTSVAPSELKDDPKDSGETPVRSPINAEFLFYLFMTPKDCDALVGDLEERHGLLHRKFGARKANFWYWTQAIRSVGPIVWAWGKNLVVKPAVAAITWAAARHLLKDSSWLVMAAEVWKRIRL